jgi:ribosomal protein S18 acetylase RimI-like enzyme
MEFKIRPYHPSDFCALNRICIQTADNGEDPSHLYPDPEVISHVYSAPYAVHDPDLCFILTGDNTPLGYIIGTRDSEAFGRWCEAEWYPILRERYPLPPEDDFSENANQIRTIHRVHSPNPAVAAYPAHLHIDTLAPARHSGNGSKLMAVFLNRLRELEIPAVHLGVGGSNARGIAFYERMGFHRVQEASWGILFGMQLK